MIKTENFIRIRGYVGNAPEYRLTSKGTEIAKFVVGTEDKLFDEVKKQWHNVVIIDSQLIKKVRSEVIKGSRISILGIVYYHKTEVGSHRKFMTDIVVDASGKIEIEVSEPHISVPYSD